MTDNATPTVPSPADLPDFVSKAMRRAWQLGQTYWQQADSESHAANRRSEKTQAMFDALVDEVRAALAAQPVPDSRPEVDPRTLLEQYDLDQSPEYRKGYEDGRLKGYEVGHRHATEHGTNQQTTVPQRPTWLEVLLLVNEYTGHVADAAQHEAASREDISKTAALAALGRLRVLLGYGDR